MMGLWQMESFLSMCHEEGTRHLSMASTFQFAQMVYAVTTHYVRYDQRGAGLLPIPVQRWGESSSWSVLSVNGDSPSSLLMVSNNFLSLNCGIEYGLGRNAQIVRMLGHVQEFSHTCSAALGGGPLKFFEPSDALGSAGLDAPFSSSCSPMQL